MWKRCAENLIVAAILLVGTRAFAQSPADAPIELRAPIQPLPSATTAPSPLISTETVRKAIEAFKRDPLHPGAPGARLNILRFAQDSKDTRVVVGPKPVPWLENKTISEDVRTNLFTAYLAGNVQSQLDQGKVANDSVAGCEQVISTYRQLQQAKPGLMVLEVEKLIEIKKQGRLAEYLADAETATNAEK